MGSLCTLAKSIDPAFVSEYLCQSFVRGPRVVDVETPPIQNARNPEDLGDLRALCTLAKNMDPAHPHMEQMASALSWAEVAAGAPQPGNDQVAEAELHGPQQPQAWSHKDSR